MRHTERLFIYGATALALLCALRAGPTNPGAEAHARTADPAASVIGVCSVVKITDELMESDRFKPARIEFEDSLRKEKLDGILAEMKALQQQVEGVSRDDPKFGELRERFGRLQREAQRETQEIARKVELKVAEQLSECYQLVRGAAVAVAEDLGYTYVLASTDPDEKLKSQTVVSLMRDVLSRPVLLSPKSADITEDVRKDLKLQ